MRVERLVVGSLSTNCYLAWSEKGGKAIIIDPGDDADYIIRKIQDLKLKPKLIVATHGHFDHILAVTELKLAFNIPFIIHQADLFLVKQAQKSAQHFLNLEVEPVVLPDKFIKEGDIIRFGDGKLKIVETPGHTPGSISLISSVSNRTIQQFNNRSIVFTGDTLFANGVGRTDLSYSSKKDLDESLKKLLKLSGRILVYPGHGEETTIEEAKKA